MALFKHEYRDHFDPEHDANISWFIEYNCREAEAATLFVCRVLNFDKYALWLKVLMWSLLPISFTLWFAIAAVLLTFLAIYIGYLFIREYVIYIRTKKHRYEST